jgi:hypothetical protein
MSEYQEEVLTNIVDLQAELRGDEPDPSAKAPKKAKATAVSDAPAKDAGELSVSEPGVTVSLSSRRAAAQNLADRIAAVNERLDRLEHDLASVTQRIQRIEPATDQEPVEAADADADVDAPWRSFIDLQKIVADRLDKR